jgi:hypothetical protein
LAFGASGKYGDEVSADEVQFAATLKEVHVGLRIVGLGPLILAIQGPTEQRALLAQSHRHLRPGPSMTILCEKHLRLFESQAKLLAELVNAPGCFVAGVTPSAMLGRLG